MIDMIGKGNLIIAQNFGAYGIEIYLACMIIYWLMSIGIEKAFGLLEQRLDKGQLFSSKAGKKQAVFILKEGEASGAGL